MKNFKLEQTLNAIANSQGFTLKKSQTFNNLDPLSGPLRPTETALKGLSPGPLKGAAPPPALTVAPEESESLKTVAAKLGSRLRKDTELFALYPFRRDKRRRMEELHDLLLLSALSFAERKGRAGLPTVCLNYYGELLAAICGLSRTTIYSYLDILASAGLLAYKGRVVSVEVEGKQVNRCDGSIMRLTLDAAIKPKLTQHDFRTVRNLSKDIKEGRTVYRFLQDSKELEQSLDQLDTKTKINLLINPSLPPVGKEKSFRLVTVQVMPGDLSNAIKALPDAKKGDRATDVDEVAHWLSLSLGDTHSLDKWRKTLWQLLRAEDVGLNPRLVGGKCLFAEVADLLEQVLAAKREGITRNAGAYALHKLKKWSWWEEVQRVPQRRVGLSLGKRINV